MKRKNATRNALCTSIISLLLCVSMLVGTTFAWFTDSVVSGQNVIAAGNLDVELFHSDKDNSGYVNTTTKLFNDITLWEPGVVAYENFRVENVGNLALQYQLSINFDNATDNGNGGTLADVLKVAVVEGGFNGNRADAQKLTGYTALKSFALNGKLEGSEISETYGIVIYWEPSDNDNDYNMNNGKTGVLSIDLGVNLFATQEMYEEDSFGEDYDALASDWDGSVGEVPAEQEGVITLTTGAELAAFAAEVNSGNSYSGKTVKLGADINLGNIAWTPIGDCESGAYFQGTFDGQGYTIYNLNVDHSTDASQFASAGLFGWVDAAMATVKNVNIDGATVKGSHWVGVIAGYFTGTIENCSVNDATVIAYNLNDDANGDKVGGIVGCLNEHGYINNNTVTNSTITGNRDIGGIAGSVAASTYEMKNNKVENTVITYATTKDYGSAGAIVSGRTGYTPDATNVASNVTIINAVSVTVSTADQLREALSSDAANINIVLANDIAIDIGTGWNMGGAETDSITIKGATPATVLTLSSTYRSYFNMANPDGTLYLQDLTLTNTHEGTHFFDFTTHFNCDLVATNVAFQKAPLTNAVTAVFNNCTFAEPVASYSLWIMAGSDVTVNGASFNATRGIKIADEDTADAVTTLAVKDAAFNTTQKAAIVVASDMGANITLSNVDISEVAADSVNAVWVDEDYADSDAQVNVTGGTKIYEGDVIADTATMNEVLSEGGTLSLTGDMANNGVTVSSGYGKTGINMTNGGVIDGNGNTLTTTGAYGTWDSAIHTTGGTIKNLNIQGGFRGIFISDSLTEDVVVDNVTIDGVCYAINSDGTADQANEYKLIVTNSKVYGWTSWSENLSAVEFTNCEFGEGDGSGYCYKFCRPYAPVTFTNCVFEEGYEIDPRANVVLEGCYYGDTLITAENIESLGLIAGDSAYVTVK